MILIHTVLRNKEKMIENILLFCSEQLNSSNGKNLRSSLTLQKLAN